MLRSEHSQKATAAKTVQSPLQTKCVDSTAALARARVAWWREHSQIPSATHPPGDRSTGHIAGRRHLSFHLRAVPASREIATWIHLLSI